MQLTIQVSARLCGMCVCYILGTVASSVDVVKRCHALEMGVKDQHLAQSLFGQGNRPFDLVVLCTSEERRDCFELERRNLGGESLPFIQRSSDGVDNDMVDGQLEGGGEQTSGVSCASDSIWEHSQPENDPSPVPIAPHLESETPLGPDNTQPKTTN